MDSEAARFVKRDQRAAVVDELPERLAAIGTHAARVRRGIARRQPLQNLAWRLIGEDNHIELIVQLARADDRIDERRVRHLPVVEHPARPALIERWVVRLVETNADRIPRERRSWTHRARR